MEKNVLVVCDLEVDYAKQLSDFLDRRKNVPFSVHTFTRPELLTEFADKNPIDVLLISQEAHYELRNVIGALDIGELFILSDDGADSSGQNCKAICKYQNADNILREVMTYYAAAEKPVSSKFFTSGKAELIGVYSPVKRSLKTSFSITLGQLLAKESRTLYINLEEYSGFNQLFKTVYMTDMSDLMYYISCKKPNFSWKLASIVQSMGELDYIPPAISPVDISSISGAQWKEFFGVLSDSGYEKVILDLGERVNGLFDILRMCTRIYTPVRDDAVSYAKMEQYEALLNIMGYEDVLEKTRKLSFSYFKGLERGLDRLAYSELGTYVRKLISEERGNTNGDIQAD